MIPLYIKGDILSCFQNLLYFLMQFFAIRTVRIIKNYYLYLCLWVAHYHSISQRNLRKIDFLKLRRFTELRQWGKSPFHKKLLATIYIDNKLIPFFCHFYFPQSLYR